MYELPLEEKALMFELMQPVIRGNDLIVEFGTFYGNSTEYFLQTWPNTFVISVDPYGNIPYPSGNRIFDGYNYTNTAKEYAYNRLAKYDNCFLYPMLSEDWVKYVLPTLRFAHQGSVFQYRAPKVSVAFLDAAHAFRDVLAEFILIWPHIIQTGVVIIDDLHELQDIIDPISKFVEHVHPYYRNQGKIQIVKSHPDYPQKLVISKC